MADGKNNTVADGKNNTVAIVLIGTGALIVTAIIIANAQKKQATTPSYNSGQPSQGQTGVDEVQRRINALLSNADFIYHLQTMKPGGAHGQPGSRDEQMKRTYERALEGGLYGSGAITGRGVNAYNYHGIPFGNASNSPVPSNGSTDWGRILGTAVDIIL